MTVLLGEGERKKKLLACKGSCGQIVGGRFNRILLRGEREKIPLQDSLFVYGRMKGKC